MLELIAQNSLYRGKEFEQSVKEFKHDKMAVKATYGVVNGKEIQIFKDPKTDTDHFKKSLKGMCYVTKDNSGKLVCTDGLMDHAAHSDGNMLQTVFRNGAMVKEYSLKEVRDRLWGGKF